MPSESIKVLLVEDNLGDARLLYEGVEEAFPGHFQIAHVRRLSETLEYLWEEPCDVVLLDLGLPDSHGLETLVLVRAQAPDVPIVVLTGFDDEDLGDRILQEGAQDYLVKGEMDSKALARSLRYAIARKATEQALVRQEVAVAKADELQRSRQRLIALHESVRQEVAAKLHDGVEDRLHAAVGRLRGLLKSLESMSETARTLREVADDLSQMCERQVGALSRQLYPATLGQGLVPTLRSFAERFSTAPALEISLDEELARQEAADGNLFSEPIGLALYRIVEEALANVIQHARAGKVVVRLDLPRPGWGCLTVKDDGQGFDLKTTRSGTGMATMEDYARAMGGECEIHSSRGLGTEIKAVLPLAQPAARQNGACELGVN